MKVIIKFYNHRVLRNSIDFDCLIRILQQSLDDCSEISFVEMTESEKRVAEGDADEFGFFDITEPFLVQTIDEYGRIEPRPDLDDRLTVEGNRLLSERKRKGPYRIQPEEEVRSRGLPSVDRNPADEP